MAARSSLVVAAIGAPAGADAPDVFAIARLVAEPFDADVVAVHVRANGSDVAVRTQASAAEVPLLIRGGEVVAALAAACDELHAVAVVLAGSAVSPRVAELAHVVGADIVLQRDDGAVVVVPAPNRLTPVDQAGAWSRA
jgi:hypothetical protein